MFVHSVHVFGDNTLHHPYVRSQAATRLYVPVYPQVATTAYHYHVKGEGKQIEREREGEREMYIIIIISHQLN